MMWLKHQQDEPDDYVVGTGESHPVREFVEKAFSYVGIEIECKGAATEEKAVVSYVDKNNFQKTLNIEHRTLHPFCPIILSILEQEKTLLLKDLLI